MIGQQELLAYHLNGRGPAHALESITDRGLIPVLMAQFGDLAGVRHDFPIVLVVTKDGGAAVESLSRLIDEIGDAHEGDPDADRLRYLALRLEDEIRQAAQSGESGRLSELWAAAARRLAEADETVSSADLSRLEAQRAIDGRLVTFAGDAPRLVIEHLWGNVQERKARLMRRRIDRLVIQLSDLLAADEARSPTALTAGRLDATFGPAFAGDLDFDRLAGLLEPVPRATLPKRRRDRVRALLDVLASQRLVPRAAGDAGDATAADVYSYVFASCREALTAYDERLPEAVELTKALLMAALEVDGAYRDDEHDAMFEALGASELRSELSALPDYLVVAPGAAVGGDSVGDLVAALSSDAPIKVLWLPDRPSERPWGQLDQAARLALGLGDVFVLQAPASHLYRLASALRRGMEGGGPALFSVFAGTVEGQPAPPYLTAAAAAESRAFPVFSYDPSAGPDWAARFHLDGNPQAADDWPVHPVSYENASGERVVEQVAVTFGDFCGLHPRSDTQMARVSRDDWAELMVPLAEYLDLPATEAEDRVPYILMADADGGVHRVVVRRDVVDAARRVRDQWRLLRELGGIRNSIAERMVAEERQRWEDRLQAEAATAALGAAVLPVGADAAAVEAVAEAAPQAAVRSDEPHIETLRCTTCNECTQINDRMFKYNANKQAYIADPSAGTYAELVLAAERCQVAIIHPGKPRNPDEPGLEELLTRAEPFL